MASEGEKRKPEKDEVAASVGEANLRQTGGYCLMIGIKAHQQEPPSIHLVAKRVGSIYSLPDHTTPICLPGNHVVLLAILLPDRCPASLGLRETSVFKCLPPDSPSNLRRSTVLLRSLKCSTNGILPLVILNSWHNNLVLNDQFCCLVTFEPMQPLGGHYNRAEVRPVLCSVRPAMQ